MTVWINNITVDCRDAHALAAFYGGLLGRDVVFAKEQWVVLGRDRPGAPHVVFQQVDEPTPGKPKAHIDVYTDDVAAATALAESLGATRGDDVEQAGMAWRVMYDPEGNPFCVTLAHD